MDLINKIILEWSYRTKKGYPDLNNEDDLRVFQSTFGFDLIAEQEKEEEETKEEDTNILL